MRLQPYLDPLQVGAANSKGFPNPFINIKFHGSLFARGDRRNPTAGLPVVVPATEVSDMNKAVLAIATAATIGVAALVAPSPAHAWRGGWGPGLAGGLIAGAVIGGIASGAYELVMGLPRQRCRRCSRYRQYRFLHVRHLPLLEQQLVVRPSGSLDRHARKGLP